MELYVLFSIVNRNIGGKLIEIHEKAGLTIVLSTLGYGTARTEHLLLYDLEQTDKVITISVVSKESLEQLINMAKHELYIDIPGNGIMMAVPMKSISGGKNLEYMTHGQIVGGGVPNMDFKHELIIVILNEGYSDTVMDVARDAGATGGTVFHAKGTGGKKAEKFYGVSLAEEKDMIYILSSVGKKTKIMQEINKHCGTDTRVGAICFSLPVSEVAGLRVIDEE